MIAERTSVYGISFVCLILVLARYQDTDPGELDTEPGLTEVQLLLASLSDPNNLITRIGNEDKTCQVYSWNSSALNGNLFLCQWRLPGLYDDEHVFRRSNLHEPIVREV